jgi:threonine dehydrogenase-like Zn-dependent dehydrogenase
MTLLSALPGMAGYVAYVPIPDFDLSTFSGADPSSIVYVAGPCHFPAADAIEVPEPSTFALLGAGAIGLLTFAWRRRKSAALDATQRRHRRELQRRQVPDGHGDIRKAASLFCLGQP